MRAQPVVVLLIGVGAAGAVFVGCATEPEDCSKGVAISVSAGTTPTFDWPRHCPAVGLSVGGWRLRGNDMLEFYPPVVYGVRPLGAVQQRPGPPPPLEVGKTYTIQLDRRHEWGGVSHLGEATFVCRS